MTTPRQAQHAIAQLIGTPEERAPHIARFLRCCLEPYYDRLSRQNRNERNNVRTLFMRVAQTIGRPPTREEFSDVLSYTVAAEVCRAAREDDALWDSMLQRYATATNNPDFAVNYPVPPATAPAECTQCHEMTTVGAPISSDSSAHGDHVCMTCASDDSGSYRQLSDGDYVCDGEAAVCGICEDTVHEINTHTVDGETVCNGCVGNSGRIVHCVDDDECHWSRNAYYSTDSGDWYSDSDNMPMDDSDEDSDSEEGRDTSVYGYSTNVLSILGRKCYVNGNPEPMRNPDDTMKRALLFGVELETCTKGAYERHEIADAVLATSFKSFGICKSDGTVTGPELVTLPADLESHRKVYQWSKWCKSMVGMADGYHAEGASAGMHVHINRAAVSPYTAGKMLVFMNADCNRVWLEQIAQRDVSQNRYCKFKADKRIADGRNVNDDRYEALNITRHTIEVRIFRSNLLEQRIYKNLEFCHALVKWCEVESAQELTAERMQAFIIRNRSEYPALAKFIESRSGDK